MRVERYQRQVAEGQTPSAFLRSYDAGNTTAQIGAAWGQVGGALEKWGAWAQKRQDEWDAATVMNAQTEFARRMSDYLDNPETGQTVTRKSGAARDLTKDTDAYADKTAQEISGLLENDRQRAVFNSGIPKAKMPFTRQASDYEARELQAFRKQAFDANIAAAQNLYLRAADSPADRARAVDMAANAIRSQYFGAPEEYIDQAIAETKSGMAAQWVAHVAQDDPMTAMQMLNDKSLGLLPETKDKLAAQIKPRAEIYEVQDIVDGLAAQFPEGHEGEALAYIRKNYDGPMEEKISSSFKMRMNELEIDQNQARRMRAQAQEDFYDDLYDRTLRGETFTKEQLDQMRLAGYLSPHRHNDAVNNWIIAAGNRAKIEKRIYNEDPTITREDMDIRVMRAMNVTQEKYQETFAQAANMAILGQLKDSDIDGLYKQGLLTTKDVTQLKAQIKAWDAGQASYYQDILSGLKENIRDWKKNAGLPEELEDGAINTFVIKAAQLDKKSPTFRKDLFELEKDVLLDMLDNADKNGAPLNGTTWYGRDYRTTLGLKQDAVKNSRFEDKKMDPFPLLTELKPSEVDLPEKAAHQQEKVEQPAAGESGFSRAVGVVFRNEGGYLYDADTKNESNRGITAGTLNRARAKGLTKAENVKELSRKDSEKIYKEMYWKPSRAGEMPEPLSTVYFDTVVNHGVGGAAKILRRAINKAAGAHVVADKGTINNDVINKLKTLDANTLANALLDKRQAQYEEIIRRNPSKKKYQRGWKNRVDKLRSALPAVRRQQPVQQPKQPNKPKAPEKPDPTAAGFLKFGDERYGRQ